MKPTQYAKQLVHPLKARDGKIHARVYGQQRNFVHTSKQFTQFVESKARKRLLGRQFCIVDKYFAI
jgi:hypothetical protein